MESRNKFLGNIISIVALALIFAGIIYLASQKPSSDLRVHFLDVGQGDAALIQTAQRQNILIDGGPDSSVIERLDSYIPFYQRKINAIVLSHPHADHVAGLNAIVQKYSVERAYITGVVHTAPEYVEFLKLLQAKKIETVEAKSGDFLDLGNETKLCFLYPNTSLAGQSVDNLNNSSIVNQLVYGRSRAIFLGDLESEGQDEMLKGKWDFGSDLIKVPHHGSKDSINLKLYEAVKPKFAVVSVGKGNRYGHPSILVIDALNTLGIRTYRTDLEGDISFSLSKTAVSAEK